MDKQHNSDKTAMSNTHNLRIQTLKKIHEVVRGLTKMNFSVRTEGIACIKNIKQSLKRKFTLLN
jgi:hypothetical protein